LIRNKKQLFSLRKNCHAAEKSVAIECARDAGYPSEQGGRHKNNNQKKW
jgi:hypothetical protein